jgi:hypothetical protein
MQADFTTRRSGAVQRTGRVLSVVFMLAVAVGSWASCSMGAEPARPISLHPDNPHYFLWRGKPTVLITSGEHYGALLNLDFDFVRYFDELRAKGLNHTRTFSGVYHEVPASFGITDNPLAPRPDRYICPWPRSDQPGGGDGGNKFDLDRWDPAYFRRLHDFMRCARDRGVVVEMTLFCTYYNDDLWKVCPLRATNNINGVGNCARQEVCTLKHLDLLRVQTRLVRKMIEELRDYGNLYYEVCNEPYFHGVTMEWQHKIVDEIVAAETDLPTRHLISLNIANGRQKVEGPHPAVSIFNFHYCVPPDVVAMNAHLNKLIGENETGFRGKDDLIYRTEGWDFLLAGGGLYNNLDYSFTTKHPDGSLRDYRSPGGGSSELRDQLRILKDFIESFDFVAMAPADDVIRQVSPEMSSRALAEPGKAYAVYLHVPLPRKPKDPGQLGRETMQATIVLDLPPGQYRAQWVDTKTGRVEATEDFEHGGKDRKLTSPRFSVDAALRIVAR